MGDEVERHLLHALETRVRAGYESGEVVEQRFLEQVSDELGIGPGDAGWRVWCDRVGAAVAEQRAREAAWVGPSTNDAIQIAFADLGMQRIIALENAGFSVSSGWEEVADARGGAPDAWGATFFHEQDVERAVWGEGLFLAFGAFARGEAHGAESLRLAAVVRSTLARHGVATAWHGTIRSRIHIEPFEWRRRMPS